MQPTHISLRYVLAAACLATLAACDDNTSGLGMSLIENADKLTVTTATFPVSSETLPAQAVLSRNTTGYLGKVRDPETGTYITGDFMTQFNTLESLVFPERDKILSLQAGDVVADSCELRLFFSEAFGDTLATMKATATELGEMVPEGQNYYSDFYPGQYLRTDADAVKLSKSYTTANLNYSDSLRQSTSYTPNLRFQLNQPYTDKDGTTYSNYGTYVMRQYYAHPEYFRNSFTFAKHVVPGFYFAHEGGLGSMAYVDGSQLRVFFRYKAEKDTVLVGNATFSGTEEVLLTSHITADDRALTQEENPAALAADQSCTYIKTPAGVFTALTLPVEDVLKGHENDTLNTVKLVVPRLNNTQHSDYAFATPATLLLVPEAEMAAFFEKSIVPDNKTSYAATFSATANSYTFSNIAPLVRHLNEQRAAGAAGWDRVVLVPIATSTDTNGAIIRVVHDMSLTTTRLARGTGQQGSPIQLTAIYSKFK